jgi:hypothetical protein
MYLIKGEKRKKPSKFKFNLLSITRKIRWADGPTQRSSETGNIDQQA